MLTLLPMLAQAQTFTVQSDSVLGDPQGRGVGAPSVAYDERHGVFYMFYEVEVAAPPTCTEAWAVGKAVSDDGLTFTRIPGRFSGPSATFECGTRSPSVVLHDDGTLAVFVQALDATSDDGVGVVTNVNGVVERRVLEDLRGLYEPTAARLDGVWSVMGIDPEVGLVVARSADLESFAFDAAPEIANGATPWSADGTAMPSLGCIDHSSYPWELYFGGFAGAQTGWAWAVSNTAGAWYVTGAYNLWTDDSAWKNLDFVTDGTSTLVYFETVGEDGIPRVGVSQKGAGIVTSALRGRDCQL